MEVRKIMTKNPACCTPDSTLEEVAHMMEMYDCGCIPVVNNHQEKNPVGTITDRDITVRTFAANKNPLDLKASDIMTTDVVTVTPDSSIQDCLEVMETKQIRRVLVVDKNNKISGIIAQADLVEHITDSAKTANFVREISESESDRSQQSGDESNRYQERNFESNRSEYKKEKKKQKNRSSSEYQTLNQPRANYRRTVIEKQSFFNGTNLLALLGSIGIGAGLGYYLKQEDASKTADKHKIRTGKLDTKISSSKQTTDTIIQTPLSSTFATESSFTQTADNNQNKVVGTVDSFNRTDDDNDLKPITEIGRTAGNT